MFPCCVKQSCLKWSVPSALHLVLCISHRKRLQTHLKLFQLIAAKRPELPAATATPSPMRFQWPVLLKSAPLRVVYSSKLVLRYRGHQMHFKIWNNLQTRSRKGCVFVHTAAVLKMLFSLKSFNKHSEKCWVFFPAVLAVRLIGFRWLKGS